METFFLYAKPAFYLLGFLVIVLTILPLFKFSAWWIRIGDFPRIQIICLCLTIIILFPVFYYQLRLPEIIFLFAISLCAVYQFYCILPYLPFYPEQTELAKSDESENHLKILISNVYMENQDFDKLVRLVEKVNPHLLLLAEVDQRWTDHLASLETKYTQNVKHPLDNTYGMALYSRLELVNPQVKFLVEDDIPSIHTNVKLESGKVVRLFCIHPRPPFPVENDRSAERDAELLIVGRKVDESEEPAIVAGDLNDVAWSRTTTLFQKISGLLDPRIGRGLYNSFHANYPFLRFPLDHVFHSEHFRLVELQRMPSIGSDHFPLFINLSYEPDAELTQPEPEAGIEDQKEADEAIKEAFEEE